MIEDDQNSRYPARKGKTAAGANPGKTPRRDPKREAKTPRAVRDGTESFRCVHCGRMIGPTIGGGRHRNHCPLCLSSRHVDDQRPGDRASACKAKMAAVGRFERPNGEPVMVHRCLGCGFERHNRLAADDDWELYMSLPIIEPRVGIVTGQVAPPESD